MSGNGNTVESKEGMQKCGPSPWGSCDLTLVYLKVALNHLSSHGHYIHLKIKDDPNFKYCTLFVSGTELRTDRRTHG